MSAENSYHVCVRYIRAAKIIKEMCVEGANYFWPRFRIETLTFPFEACRCRVYRSPMRDMFVALLPTALLRLLLLLRCSVAPFAATAHTIPTTIQSNFSLLAVALRVGVLFFHFGLRWHVGRRPMMRDVLRR